MSKKILLIGAGSAIVLLLVVGSFSVGMFVGGVFNEGEMPAASTVLQATVEEILETKNGSSPNDSPFLPHLGSRAGSTTGDQ